MIFHERNEEKPLLEMKNLKGVEGKVPWTPVGEDIVEFRGTAFTSRARVRLLLKHARHVYARKCKNFILARVYTMTDSGKFTFTSAIRALIV